MHKVKYGKVRIDIKCLMRDKDEFSNMFSALKFIPIKIEESFIDFSSMYIGYSPYFDEIEQGVVIPEYKIIADKFENRPTAYRFEKIGGNK